MARANLKASSARRSTRAVVRHSPSKSSVLESIGQIAMSRPARTVYYVLGTAGLTALAVALVGPKRLEREVIKPLRGAIEPQAEKLWSDSKPLRDQIAGLFKSASPNGREKLIKSFQSWVGHFHAT
ncbi:MAG TPA: hypothetical protein VEV64_04080 [Rhizomicrobium sp.]|jgi:hypothetical protein|nr:hypothetical protein [Rhizomicrobium sp.]